MSRLNKNQSGAAAMLTVIIMTIIFSTLTLSYLRLSIRDARQSTDNDLNLRAYYAAESGVEDAKRIIGKYYEDGILTAAERTSLNLGDDCARASDSATPTSAVISTALDTEISCQIIDHRPSDVIVSLQQNQSTFVPLKAFSGGPVTSVTIEWHKNVDDDTTVPRTVGDNTLPQVGSWGTPAAPIPAMLEAGLFSHPASGNISRTDIVNRRAYVNPVDGDGTVTVGDFDSHDALGPILNEADCNGGAAGVTRDYFCTLTIEGLSADAHYLHLTSLYNRTDIRVTMNNAADDDLEFDDVQALIDVTGRAADVSRRILARVTLLTSADLLPISGLTTADQLCKLVRITGPGVAVDNCAGTSPGGITPFVGVGVPPPPPPPPGGGGALGNAAANQCVPNAANCDPDGNWIINTNNTTGPNPVLYKWHQTGVNTSNIAPVAGQAPPGDVESCVYVWGDGTSGTYYPGDPECNPNGGAFTHNYPDVHTLIESSPVDAGGGRAGCRRYTWTLTMNFTAASGRPTTVAQYYAYIPFGRADDPGEICYNHHRPYP